ncbi:helix-turn-helix transcriptional regulator [Marinobacterium lutimaris]|uniref:helix-turn-helix transcriptional regulator n=1 Tax=Marinobacterium lutimaris TaxID=568106 RepID=UPI000CDF0BD8
MSSTNHILRRREVEQRVGLSCSTLYRLMEKGDFPKPLKLTAHAVGWRASDVDRWLDSRCNDNAA